MDEANGGNICQGDHMTNGFQVVRDFEQALCDYTGAKFCVSTSSCTMAILLAVAYHVQKNPTELHIVDCPKRTYVGVPMAIHHAGAEIAFTDKPWLGEYRLDPLPVWDSARLLTSGMYRHGTMQCLSFHWTKTLGIQQGGAIIHDSPTADKWLRKARFDGRTEGVPADQDDIDMIGWHCYMSPEVAAAGLVRMMHLPKDNEPLPNSNYPDCSQLRAFK